MGCSCHINPPCSWCEDSVYCCSCGKLVQQEDCVYIDKDDEYACDNDICNKPTKEILKMKPNEFVWWLNGFMQCCELKPVIPTSNEWSKIKETLQIVTCWEIEQGDINK